MKKHHNQWLVLFMCLGLATPVFAELGATLLKVNAAIVIVTKARDIQKKYQGPDAAPVPLQSPAPTPGGGAEYVSPFTKDGQLTTWAQTGMKASVAGAAGAQVGGRAAQLASGQVAGRIPVVGGFLSGMFNKKATEKAKETGAALAMGGWDSIRESSDYSFETADELAVFMHANHVEHPDYPSALAATIALYPELEERYEPAVEKAVEYAHANPQATVATAQQAAPESAVAPPQQSEKQETAQKESKSKGFLGVFGFGAKSEEETSAALEAETEAEPEPEAPEQVAASSSPQQVLEEIGLSETPEPSAQQAVEPQPEVSAEKEASPKEQVQVADKSESMRTGLASQDAPAAESAIPNYDVAEASEAAVEAEMATVDEPVEVAAMAEVTTEASVETVAEEPSETPVERAAPSIASLPVPAPRPSINGLTVEERLEVITQARVRGEISGDEYLAQRRRIIYGE